MLTSILNTRTKVRCCRERAEKVKPSVKLQFWKRWIKADFWLGFVRLTTPRKSTDETYQNSSKLETIDFLRTCPYRTRNTSENPALALFSVYLLLKARASTSSIFDEKLLIGLVFKSPFGSFRILNLDFHARSHFARSTIPEEKWGTTRSLAITYLSNSSSTNQNAALIIEG